MAALRLASSTSRSSAPYLICWATARLSCLTSLVSLDDASCWSAPSTATASPAGIDAATAMKESWPRSPLPSPHGASSSTPRLHRGSRRRLHLSDSSDVLTAHKTQRQTGRTDGNSPSSRCNGISDENVQCSCSRLMRRSIHARCRSM